MTDAGSRTHHLHIPGCRAASVAEAVLVGDRARADIGDDFHIGVRVWWKPSVRRDRVVVPHPQRAPAHALGVVVIGKRELVLGAEPTVVCSAQGFKGSAFDHLRPPFTEPRLLGREP